MNFDGFGERVIFLMIGLPEMLDFCGRNGVGVGVWNDVLMGEILLFLGEFERS